MRFLFLNQYAPPDPSPTARLLGELADVLRADGHEVAFVSQSQDYTADPRVGGGGSNGNCAPCSRSGATADGPRRTRGRTCSGVVLAAGVVGGGGVPGVASARAAGDLDDGPYPELAVALGEIGPGVAARVIGAAMRWAYRRAALTIALDDDMRDHLRATYGIEARVLPPWPARTFEAQIDTTPGSPWTWLYSGNLGRAHEWQTLLDAQRLLETRALPVRLVFQGDGAARPAAIAHAQTLGLTRCEWKGYVDESALAASLLDAQVLAVTQRPATRGLLWPSKLAVLARLPRPLLFVGPVDGAIARQLRERGTRGSSPPGTRRASRAGWRNNSTGRRRRTRGPSAASPRQARTPAPRWPVG